MSDILTKIKMIPSRTMLDQWVSNAKEYGRGSFFVSGMSEPAKQYLESCGWRIEQWVNGMLKVTPNP